VIFNDENDFQNENRIHIDILEQENKEEN